MYLFFSREMDSEGGKEGGKVSWSCTERERWDRVLGDRDKVN